MKKNRLAALIAAGRALSGKALLKALPTALLLLLSLPAFSQQMYHTNDLTPPLALAGKLNASSAGKQVGSGSGSSGVGTLSHAYLFTGNALTAVDLNPPGYYSQATSISDDGFQQCGYGFATGTSVRSLLWSGSSSSVVDLGPLSNFSSAYCHGVNNGQQIGESQNLSYFIASSHATLWNGAAAAVDLHPADPLYPFSVGMGIKGGEQVGFESQAGFPATLDLGWQFASHAIRWAGSAASAVDLHPAGFDTSRAVATNGIQQGGWGYIIASVSQHALLWNGDAINFVDLHPAGYAHSAVRAMNATIQVGDGWVGPAFALGSVRHALAWSGTADSVIDLNQYLPAGYTLAVATGIDGNGNIVGYAYNGPLIGVNTMEPPPDAIAVVFAPGPAPASQLISVTLDSANVAPGAVVNGTATLASAAPTGGVTLTFLSTNLAIAATPAAVVIPEGATRASFSLPITGATPPSVR